MIALWLFGLWINVQKVPERFFTESPRIQKYFSSNVLKSIIVIICVIGLHFLTNEALLLSHHRPSTVITAFSQEDDHHSKLEESKSQLLKAEEQLKFL